MSKYIELFLKRFDTSKYAKRDFKTARFIKKVILKNKSVDTKINYVSTFRHWVNYTFSVGANPFEMPLDPELAAFFIADRAIAMNNIKSIDRWQATLRWICDLSGYSNDWINNPFYKNFKYSLRKQYLEASDPR